MVFNSMPVQASHCKEFQSMNEFLLQLIDILKRGSSLTEHGDRVEPGYVMLIELEELAAKIRETK